LALAVLLAIPRGQVAAEAAAPADPPAASSAATEATAVPGEEANAIPPALQGPAIRTPREILEVLEQRKRALDQREADVRVAEGRLASIRAEVEQILARYEAQVKAAQQERSKTSAEAEKASLAQVAKMYETMAPEEAAARIEKMPNKMALQVLRMLKGQTAGAILALVSADKAAKLTERMVSRP
jgi:flagellar motility protein MotE (MotC chaperone)